ncbi:TVP38/TMEM64 family protein [Candidatus Babeliales bacterium]|nr:TVP38/TMEM64 family protein [Candidatus Babeliales bacterium]
MKTYLKYLLFAVIASLPILFYVFNFNEHLTVANLKYYQCLLKEMVDQHQFLSIILFMLAYTASVVASLPLGGLFTLTGGFLFGVFPTVICVDISATAGAIGAFLLARYVFGEALHKKYPYYISKLSGELSQYGWSYMLSIRLNAAIPFFITNMIIGLTPLPLKTFIWTTAVGMIPSITLFAFAGSRLATIHTIGDIVTPHVLMAFGALALLPIFSMLARRWYRA